MLLLTIGDQFLNMALIGSATFDKKNHTVTMHERMICRSSWRARRSTL